MTKHTPGKMTHAALMGSITVGFRDEAIFHCGLGLHQADKGHEQEANARRIVACWNACDGISTEALEEDGVAGHIANQAFITHMNAANGLNLGLEGGACRVLAESFAGQFKGSGAVNYLEVGFDHKDTGPVVVTMQRAEGKTPAQLKHEVEVQRDELLEALRKADEDFDSEGFAPDGPYRAPIRAAIAKATQS